MDHSPYNACDMSAGSRCRESEDDRLAEYSDRRGNSILPWSDAVPISQSSTGAVVLGVLTAPVAIDVMRNHLRFCHLCQGNCGIEVTVDEDEKVQSIRPDAANSFSGGFMCPKATALKYLHEDPDRISVPLVRAESGWMSTSWDDACARAARDILRIRDQFGPRSIAVFFGNAAALMAGYLTHFPSLTRHLEGAQFFSPNSIDYLAAYVAAKLLFGRRWPAPDLDRTQFFLIVGHNPAVSNGSGYSAPNMKGRIRAIQERGGRVVVVDPRRTETAQIASEHIFIRPRTDALFLASLLKVILDLAPPIPEYVSGLIELRVALDQYSPEITFQKTGVEGSTTRRIAAEFLRAPGAVAFGRLGLCIQENATLSMWLLQLINVVSGNLNRSGGLIFEKPLLGPGIAKAISFYGELGRHHTRVRGLPTFGEDRPVVTLAEEILTPGRDQIKALIVLGSNPVLTIPNGRLLEKALPCLEFMVSLDIYVNETSRFAHIILPNASPLEHEVFPIVNKNNPLRRHAQYSPAAVPKPAGTLYDWEIMAGLDRAFSLASNVTPLPPQTFREAVDKLLADGPDELSVDDLLQNPHGVDLGPIEPAPGPTSELLMTPNSRVNCAEVSMLSELARLARDMQKPLVPGELRLVTRRDLRSMGSFLHNSEKMMKGANRFYLEMHPNDMSARTISDGDIVRVSSRANSIELPVRASVEVMAGVVSLPYGWGHGREGTRLRVANLDTNAGASINDVTDESSFDPISGAAAANGITVTVDVCASNGPYRPA